jgi:hypothetical protein
MQFSPAILRRASSPAPAQRKSSSAPCFSAGCGSPQATAEIHAFIATRDLALADAERNVTGTTLNRAFLANELVQNCLKPTRSPYASQSLPECEAATERKRCDAVHCRISQLRACAVAAA